MGVSPSSTELLSGNVFELFDPLKQPNRPNSWPAQLNKAGTNTNTPSPPFVTPTAEIKPIPAITTATETKPTIATASPSPSSSSSLSYPYPIKLRLKLTTFPDIKPFSQLVQRIRHENHAKQV